MVIFLKKANIVQLLNFFLININIIIFFEIIEMINYMIPIMYYILLFENVLQLIFYYEIKMVYFCSLMLV